MKLRWGRLGSKKAAKESEVSKSGIGTNLPLSLSDEILPDWELSFISFTYISSESPDREELTKVSEYLESAYGMRVLMVKNRLLTGKSWTDENARFSIDVTLTGN